LGVPITIRTGRGVYTLRNTAPGNAATIDRSRDWIAVTISLDRADGVEKVAFRCRIAAALLGSAGSVPDDELIARLAPWIEREFEQVRESALKTIRTERRLLEISFDSATPGPF
jgi:hypothetical protein